MARRILVALVAVASLLAAVPGGAAPGLPLVRLETVAVLDEPVAMAVRPGDEALYVAEKGGTVRALRDGAVAPVLDISDRTRSDGEQGLLGLTFTPDGATLIVSYTERFGGATMIVAYPMTGAGVADATDPRTILSVAQPFPNHNGGNVAFGPDGMLYIGLGDGGGAGDPLSAGQNLGTLLGKMLRIDPDPAGGYAIPAGNPFAGVTGARAEIWAYGLRNPWRWSFDRATGDLWIADVGQRLWEEINYQPASSGGGENYGWNAMEGSHSFGGRAEPANHTPPVYEYSHAMGGCSVTGGAVYRGAAIPELRGMYVFADFCLSRVQALAPVGGTLVALETGGLAQFPASFGEDAAGELYVLSLEGPVSKIVPALPA